MRYLLRYPAPALKSLPVRSRDFSLMSASCNARLAKMSASASPTHSAAPSGSIVVACVLLVRLTRWRCRNRKSEAQVLGTLTNVVSPLKNATPLSLVPSIPEKFWAKRPLIVCRYLNRTRSKLSHCDMSERITLSPGCKPCRTSTWFTELRPSFTFTRTASAPSSTNLKSRSYCQIGHEQAAQRRARPPISLSPRFHRRLSQLARQEVTDHRSPHPRSLRRFVPMDQSAKHAR